jgi:hypothetical protein
MNRTKHMKHKKNTRRRHKSRNKTRKTRKPYKRCRTRSQRGGKTKAEVYDDVLSEMLNHIELIPLYFIHNTFDTFLELYGKDVLKRVVCGDYSEEAIRLDATTQLANMKRILDGASKPTPIIVKLKDLFLNRNFTQNWTDFVINLKKTVDTRYSADLNLKKRMDALKEDPLKPQPPPPPLHLGLISPPSRPAATARPAAIIPGSEVDKRPYPPPGFRLQGNVWIGTNTVVPEDYYKKPPALPAAPPPPAPPTPPTPLTGQALRDALFALKND